ncbi:MAG: GyrI-like domain-containing protein [Actinomycetota bacterium]|nr:GyrI-like domain-containing protein [Actinomycetota bacterium]
MDKIDLKKELKEYYWNSTKEIRFVKVPPMNFLMVDGKGDPNISEEFTDAIQSLYSLAYTIKFTLKKESEIDYGVMPLEGLWWTDDMSKFSQDNKKIWKWTIMIMQPKFIPKKFFNDCLEEVKKRKNFQSLSKIRFEKYSEGLSAQIMYIGPYSDEGPTIMKVHDFIKGKGYELKGKHHEIYLGDFRRTKPEKLKTIIRQPIAKIEGNKK